MQQLMRNKGKKVEWNEKAQATFENIKRELCEAPVLGMPTERGMYVLHTDASVVSEYYIRSKNGMGELFSGPLLMVARC